MMLFGIERTDIGGGNCSVWRAHRGL